MRTNIKSIWMVACCVVIWTAILMGFSEACASALPPFGQVFTDAYKPKAGGTVAAKACAICHDGAPPKLNPYGTDIKAVLTEAHTKTLTPAMLHSLDNKDSDGDGWDNASEIAADTLPGDPSSKPAGSPPPKTTPNASGEKKATTDGGSSEPSVFDIKGWILPKHGQHPIIVHFPVALFIISILFDLLALWRKDNGLASAAYLNLVIAALSSPIAVITGFVAWQYAYGGISGESFKGTLQQHLIAGIITSLLIGVLWMMRAASRKSSKQLATPAYLILALITMALLSFTGHVGGFLSGVN